MIIVRDHIDNCAIAFIQHDFTLVTDQSVIASFAINYIFATTSDQDVGIAIALQIVGSDSADDMLNVSDAIQSGSVFTRKIHRYRSCPSGVIDNVLSAATIQFESRRIKPIGQQEFIRTIITNQFIDIEVVQSTAAVLQNTGSRRDQSPPVIGQRSLQGVHSVIGIERGCDIGAQRRHCQGIDSRTTFYRQVERIRGQVVDVATCHAIDLRIAQGNRIVTCAALITDNNAIDCGRCAGINRQIAVDSIQVSIVSSSVRRHIHGIIARVGIDIRFFGSRRVSNVNDIIIRAAVNFRIS